MSPVKLPVSQPVPAASFGVMEHVAKPLALVVAEPDCVGFDDESSVS